MKHRQHRHQDFQFLVIQCKELTEQVQSLQNEIDSLHEQYGERYQNHANALLFLQNKNAELHTQLHKGGKVLPIPPHYPKPKPPIKKAYDTEEEEEYFSRALPNPIPNKPPVQMPNINIIPHPIPHPPVPHPKPKPKCFEYPFEYPYYYPYSYPYYYPYYGSHYYRDGPHPTSPHPPIKKEFVPLAKPPIHPMKGQVGEFAESDSDEEFM